MDREQPDAGAAWDGPDTRPPNPVYPDSPAEPDDPMHKRAIQDLFAAAVSANAWGTRAVEGRSMYQEMSDLLQDYMPINNGWATLVQYEAWGRDDDQPVEGWFAERSYRLNYNDVPGLDTQTVSVGQAHDMPLDDQDLLDSLTPEEIEEEQRRQGKTPFPLSPEDL